MKWRIVKNECNSQARPWNGSFGIEEDDDRLAVPAVVCWFYIGYDKATVQRVVDLHNQDVENAR
jgi:hypothetical protein